MYLYIFTDIQQLKQDIQDLPCTYPPHHDPESSHLLVMRIHSAVKPYISQDTIPCGIAISVRSFLADKSFSGKQTPFSVSLLLLHVAPFSTGPCSACVGKTHAQLQQTQDSLEEQLQSGEAADPEFSAAILKRLRIHKAKAKLREIHRDLMQQNLDRTQLVPDDGADVPREMGWDDDKQVCTHCVALPMQPVPVLFCCPAKLPGLPRFSQIFSFLFITQFLQQIGKHSLAFWWSICPVNNRHQESAYMECFRLFAVWWFRCESVKMKADGMRLLLNLLASTGSGCWTVQIEIRLCKCFQIVQVYL